MCMLLRNDLEIRMGTLNKSVSIIIPLYKGKKYIEKLLRIISTMAYDKTKIEIIFVNDFPEERIHINNLEYDFAIKVITNEKNIGIHGSRINGLKVAKGEFILFLDQDDTLTEQYFHTQFNAIRDKQAVFSNGYWRNGELIYTDSNPTLQSYSVEEYLKCGYPLVSLGQLMIKREVIPIEWTEDPMEHNGCDDLLLWILMMLHKVTIAVNDAPVYIHEEDGNNASLNYRQMALSIQDVKNRIMQLEMVDKKSKELLEQKLELKIDKYRMYEKINAAIENTEKSAVEQRLLQNGIQKVALYGVGIYGKWLIDLLKGSSIYVAYAIDKRADVKCLDIPMGDLTIVSGEGIDAIIVTPVFDYAEIKKEIIGRCNCKILSLEEILMKDSKG